jgi:hypothetical protein
MTQPHYNSFYPSIKESVSLQAEIVSHHSIWKFLQKEQFSSWHLGFNLLMHYMLLSRTHKYWITCMLNWHNNFLQIRDTVHTLLARQAWKFSFCILPKSLFICSLSDNNLFEKHINWKSYFYSVGANFHIYFWQYETHTYFWNFKVTLFNSQP